MKKQKKIIAIMLSLSLIFGSSNNLMSYAVNEDKSNVNDTVSRENSNLEMGPKYKKKKKNLIQPYSLQTLENGVELGEEALDDLEQLKNIEYLEKITDEKYEVALAHENGDYTYLSSAETIEEAKKIVNSKSNQKNLEKFISHIFSDLDQINITPKITINVGACQIDRTTSKEINYNKASHFLNESKKIGQNQCIIDGELYLKK